MAQLLSGFNGNKPCFSDSLSISFGKKAILFNLLKRDGKQGLKFKGANAADGHRWKADDIRYAGDENNALTELSCGLDPSSETPVFYTNHLQIFKKDTEISGSAKAQTGTCVLTVDFQAEQRKNAEKLAMDIDAALASDRAPVQRVGKTTAGKMAGIKHYVPAASTFDLLGAALDVEKQTTAEMKLLYDAGVVGEKIVKLCGSDVYEDITTHYGKQARLAPGDGVGGMQITEVITAYGKVTLIPYPRLAANESIMLVPKYAAFIPYREEKNKDVTDSSCDGMAKRDLVECTLEIHPSTIVWTKNAGRVV